MIIIVCKIRGDFCDSGITEVCEAMFAATMLN